MDGPLFARPNLYTVFVRELGQICGRFAIINPPVDFYKEFGSTRVYLSSNVLI